MVQVFAKEVMEKVRELDAEKMKPEKAFHDFLPTTGTVKIETTVRLACISWVQQSADHLLLFPYTLYGRYHWYGTELQILVPKARYLSAYIEYCSNRGKHIFLTVYHRRQSKNSPTTGTVYNHIC